MSALTYLQAIAPSYASMASVSVYLEMASAEISLAYFGTQYDMAMAYLTAHKMCVMLDPSRAGGTPGSIQSKSEGQLSASFGTNGIGGMNALAQTTYGLEFMRIRNTRSLSGIAVTGGNDVGY
jgi:hypothetical protein